MQQRGRKGAGAVAVAGGVVALVERPEPPLDLNPDESDVWRDTVEGLPADWFRPETFPLLRQWCRHTVSARRVAQLLDAAMSRDEIDVGELKDLLAMQARETASLKAMAASMRISQQATIHAEKAGTSKAKVGTVKRPWE